MHLGMTGTGRVLTGSEDPSGRFASFILISFLFFLAGVHRRMRRRQGDQNKVHTNKINSTRLVGDCQDNTTNDAPSFIQFFPHLIISTAKQQPMQNGFVLAHHVHIIWAKHARGWRVTMKKHVFSSHLPFLISSPGVSMATKSLSDASLPAVAVTSIESLALSVSPRVWKHRHLGLTNNCRAGARSHSMPNCSHPQGASTKIRQQPST